jgi:cell division protein FtsB
MKKQRLKRPHLVLGSFLTEKGISGRLLVLFLVVFAMAITLAPPTQHYFAQRAQISALQADVADNQKKLSDALAELQLWRDPNYVKSQARERLHFVMPGERQYIVIGTNQSVSTDANTAAPVSEKFPLGIPWYARVISSITSVGATNP